MSQPKSHSLNHTELWTLSPSEGTVGTRRGPEGALVLGNCNFGTLWSLAGLTWAWLFQLLLAAKLLGYSKSQPPSLTRQEESRGQPNRWDRHWRAVEVSTPCSKLANNGLGSSILPLSENRLEAEEKKKKWNCLRRKWTFHGQFLVEKGKNSK